MLTLLARNRDRTRPVPFSDFDRHRHTVESVTTPAPAAVGQLARTDAVADQLTGWLDHAQGRPGHLATSRVLITRMAPVGGVVDWLTLGVYQRLWVAVLSEHGIDCRHLDSDRARLLQDGHGTVHVPDVALDHLPAARFLPWHGLGATSTCGPWLHTAALARVGGYRQPDHALAIDPDVLALDAVRAKLNVPRGRS